MILRLDVEVAVRKAGAVLFGWSLSSQHERFGSPTGGMRSQRCLRVVRKGDGFVDYDGRESKIETGRKPAKIRCSLLPGERGPIVGRLMGDTVGQMRFWEESDGTLLQLSRGALTPVGCSSPQQQSEQ